MGFLLLVVLFLIVLNTAVHFAVEALSAPVFPEKPQTSPLGFKSGFYFIQCHKTTLYILQKTNKNKNECDIKKGARRMPRSRQAYSL